jgi:hypothetical protein
MREDTVRTPPRKERTNAADAKSITRPPEATIDIRKRWKVLRKVTPPGGGGGRR